MNSPDSEVDPHLFQSFSPREDMLVNAVNQRAIKIEKKSGQRRIIGSSTALRSRTTRSGFHGVLRSAAPSTRRFTVFRLRSTVHRF
jgi:hypothetical protein